MNTREREVMDALALAARRSLEWIESRDLACDCGNPTCRTNALRSSVAAYDALIAEGSASSEGQITPGMIREAEGHLPLNLPKNDAYPRWQAMADFLNRAIVNPNEPCPCCNVTPAGDVLDHLPSPPSASSEEAEAEMHAFAEILAAAQKPFDPDVAKAIRDNWRKLFDDDTFSQPAHGEPLTSANEATAAREIVDRAVARWRDNVLRADPSVVEPWETRPAPVAWEKLAHVVRDAWRTEWRAAHPHHEGIYREAGYPAQGEHEQRSCEGSELPALERYGIEWRGPHMPIALPMPDGYWTPWHIAEAALKEREHERRPIADWERQSMEFLAKKLHERGDELSEDSASWLEKFALESAHPRGLPAGSDAQLKVLDEVIRLLESPHVMPTPTGGVNYSPEHYFGLLHDFKRVRTELAAAQQRQGGAKKHDGPCWRNSHSDCGC